MLLAKMNTKEKMEDGSYRNVPAGTPFISSLTSRLQNVQMWATYVTEDSPEAEEGRKYLKSIKAVDKSEDIVDAEFEETKEVKTEEVINEKIEPIEEADSEEVKTEEVEKEEVDLSKYDAMKNNELKALLKEAKIEYKNSMNGTMLKTLCAENKL